MHVGVDACKKGWLAVAAAPGGEIGASFLGSLLDVDIEFGPVDTIVVDMPIGALPDSFRALDKKAREFVGARRNSVFQTPPREVLDAGSHAEATALCQRLTSQGISQQSYALAPKILEVEAALTQIGDRLYEGHPEVSFAAMKGSPLEYPKRSWNGMGERVELLRASGIELPTALPGAKAVPADDVIDAAALLWSARRISDGKAERISADPEALNDRPLAIWY